MGSSSIILRVLIAGCLASPLVPQPVTAHVQGHGDAEDVEGKLDIKRAAMERSGSQLTVTVRTYDRFRGDDLHGDEQGFYILIDSRGDRRWDFTFRMSTYESPQVPHCTLYGRDGKERHGNAATKRPRSMACSFPRSDLNQTRHIRWRVRSYDFPNKDLAPNSGWYRH